jgi:hypothetical protein
MGGGKMKKVVFGMILMALFSSVAFSREIPRISEEELRAMVGDPNAIILDVRIGDEWKSSDK